MAVSLAGASAAHLEQYLDSLDAIAAAALQHPGVAALEARLLPRAVHAAPLASAAPHEHRPDRSRGRGAGRRAAVVVGSRTDCPRVDRERGRDRQAGDQRLVQGPGQRQARGHPRLSRARDRPERRGRARLEHRSVAAADGIRQGALAGRIGHHAARPIRTGARPQRRRRTIHRDDHDAARRRRGGAAAHYRRTGRRPTNHRARIYSPRPLVLERRHSPHRRARVAFSALDGATC